MKVDTNEDARWVRAADRAELREGDVVGAQVEGRDVALYLVDGQPYATDDLCTHGHARLSEGFLMDDCIECPLHQGQFDIRTGAPLCEPVSEPIRVYPTRFVGDELQIGLPD